VKVIRDDEVALLIGDDQVLAMPFVGPGEQQMRIANRERKLVTRVRTRNGINIDGRKMLDLNIPKFAAVIHDVAPKNVN
jgi:hypothetical protein